MSPREVFRDPLLQGASAIVIAHNHPSGDATPSVDDEAVTRRLGAAGELVGVEVSITSSSVTSAGPPSPVAA